MPCRLIPSDGQEDRFASTEDAIMIKEQLRNVAAALALATLLPAGTATAQSGGWREKYPIVKYGVIPVETQT